MALIIPPNRLKKTYVSIAEATNLLTASVGFVKQFNTLSWVCS